MARLEGESVGSTFGLYGVYVILQVDGIICGDYGCLLLLYEFIFEIVYLGDGFCLAIMLPKFLLIWSCL